MEPWMVDAIKLIVPILGSLVSGGLAGGWYSHRVTREDARERAITKENTTIAALMGELRLARHICENNAGRKGEALPPFLHLPLPVAARVTFEERDSFPRLANLQQQLEQYSLTVTEVNESINLYQLAFLASSPAHPAHDSNRLRDYIADVCAGSQALAAIGGTYFYLPSLIDRLSQQLALLSADQ